MFSVLHCVFSVLHYTFSMLHFLHFYSAFSPQNSIFMLLKGSVYLYVSSLMWKEEGLERARKLCLQALTSKMDELATDERSKVALPATECGFVAKWYWSHLQPITSTKFRPPPIKSISHLINTGDLMRWDIWAGSVVTRATHCWATTVNKSK